MTGFPGERTNRAVALVTDDFRLYHRIVPFMASRGITILGLAPGDPVPPAVRVLLDGPPADPRSIPVLDSLEATLLSVYQALDRRRRQGGYARVVFGVDPGHVIGLAVLCDGEVFLVAESMDMQEACDRIASWSTGLDAKAWEVHVGDGHPEVGRPLLRLMRERLPGMRVALTPEGATTPWS
ncbi:MAG TPA: hypothetical protein VFH47_04920, partial [Candidatus Thermoplasmatota archaeon]|nr:hypothetical protein [Candidatus Thermoplasmatota archaeon]